jgi:hypothetical protein
MSPPPDAITLTEILPTDLSSATQLFRKQRTINDLLTHIRNTISQHHQ